MRWNYRPLVWKILLASACAALAVGVVITCLLGLASGAEVLLWYMEPGYRAVILCLMVLVFAVCFLGGCLFVARLKRIAGAVHGVLEENGDAVVLPEDMEQVAQALTQIQHTLSRRAAESSENERRKNELIAFLAHDLKTPLTSVMGYLSLLQENPNLDVEQREKYIGIALEKTMRLEELLGEFFDISRLHLGGENGEMQPIGLSILLAQLADEFYPLFAEKALEYRAEITPQLQVMGEPDKLARVFDNVLRNAVSYSSPGGIVLIRAERAGDGQVEITVRNQGLEIPEGELANIFMRFYRLDTARSTRTGGAGLGLAIAKEIVEAHGGTIRAERNGAFTSFVITLPLLVGGT
ncbi:MAG: HAMP domain-containing histidine kinase [Oscillospiraceae bacterium]|nr:HAMP domain-containing histidine kinase [Oscillospiraceae bacterium]